MRKAMKRSDKNGTKELRQKGGNLKRIERESGYSHMRGRVTRTLSGHPAQCRSVPGREERKRDTIN